MTKYIYTCADCPFTKDHREQGFCATVCRFISYGAISYDDVLEKCPLKKEEITVKLAEK